MLVGQRNAEVGRSERRLQRDAECRAPSAGEELRREARGGVIDAVDRRTAGERVLATLRTTKARAVQSVALFAFDPKPNLNSYKGPRIAIIGSLLQSYPLSIHKVVPSIEAQVIEGTSHWPFLDKPAGVPRAARRIPRAALIGTSHRVVSRTARW